jgi:hypothetical protein
VEQPDPADGSDRAPAPALYLVKQMPRVQPHLVLSVPEVYEPDPDDERDQQTGPETVPKG